MISRGQEALCCQKNLICFSRSEKKKSEIKDYYFHTKIFLLPPIQNGNKQILLCRYTLHQYRQVTHKTKSINGPQLIQDQLHTFWQSVLHLLAVLIGACRISGPPLPLLAYTMLLHKIAPQLTEGLDPRYQAPRKIRFVRAYGRHYPLSILRSGLAFLFGNQIPILVGHFGCLPLGRRDHTKFYPTNSQQKCVRFLGI